MEIMWLSFALLTPALFGILNIIDKVLRTKHVDDTVALGLAGGIFNLPLIIVLLFIGVKTPELPYLAAAIGAGVLWFIAGFPYIHAMVHEEVSRVVPLWNLSAIFILFLATLFLGEVLSISGYIAFVLILSGAFLLSARSFNVFKLRESFYLMLLANVLWAVGAVLTKFVYGKVDFWSGFFWITLGSFLAALFMLLFKIHRMNIHSLIFKSKKNTLYLLLGRQLSGIAVRTTYNAAVLLGPVSLTAVLGGFQGMFVLVFAIILSIWMPNILKEEIDKKTISLKILAIILMIGGLALIYLK